LKNAIYYYECANKKSINPNSFSGFEDEIDWIKFLPEHVMQHAHWVVDSAKNIDWAKQFFEINSTSFFEQIGQHFVNKFKEHEKNPKLHGKYRVGETFFNAFTIEQLDKFSSLMTKKGYNIQEKMKSFVSAYFQKVFSNELSAENQEYMTQEDKFENLQRLYQYAKQRNLPASLVTNLLHEILMLSIKLDTYKEDLFKEYIKRPLERNYNLK